MTHNLVWIRVLFFKRSEPKDLDTDLASRNGMDLVLDFDLDTVDSSSLWKRRTQTQLYFDLTQRHGLRLGLRE